MYTRNAFSDYPLPAMAVDLAILTVSGDTLQVLLMRREDAGRHQREGPILV